jgi:MFS family permease
MFRWIGRAFAVFVGIVLTLYGVWIFLINIIGALGGTFSNPWWVLPMVLLAGVLAATGGVLFILSFWRDRFHTRTVRLWGVVLMILGSLLPTSLTTMLLILALLMVPTLFATFPSTVADFAPEEEDVTSG